MNPIIMTHFLTGNQDMAYQVEAPAVEKARREARHSTRKKRFAVAVTACLLVMVIGISAGAGGAWLASEFLGEGTAAGRPVSRGNVPQIPDGASLAVNSANQDDEIFLSSDTLVINTNTNQLTPEQLYAKVKHGVVGIEISKRASGGRFAPAAEDTQLAGSGFMFTTDGYLLTNYHVIEGAEKVVVLVDDYDDPEEFHRYEAEIVGTDRSTDLAVLKIVRDELFKALPIGDSSNLRVGTFVCPVGFPLGLQKSMTYGIVSGLNREFDDGGYELSSIQFDAAVNSGNSGGPLFDLYGNVVGIVNKKIVFGNLVDNIGLAITIDEAKPVINDLLLYGRVMSRAMLGIVPLELNEYIAMSFRLDVTEGIFVSSIYKEAPAYDSDLARGDVIVEIDGIPVAGVTDVQSILRDKRPGDIVELTVIRWSETGGQRRVVIEIELVNEADLPPR